MFFEQIKAQANAGKLLSKERFSTDGTLLDAAASIKRFKRKDRDDTPDDGPQGDAREAVKLERNADVDFHGEQFCNATHRSPPMATRCCTARPGAKKQG